MTMAATEAETVAETETPPPLFEQLHFLHSKGRRAFFVTLSVAALLLIL